MPAKCIGKNSENMGGVGGHVTWKIPCRLLFFRRSCRKKACDMPAKKHRVEKGRVSGHVVCFFPDLKSFIFARIPNWGCFWDAGSCQNREMQLPTSQVLGSGHIWDPKLGQLLKVA